jgi:hypothetical protein
MTLLRNRATRLMIAVFVIVVGVAVALNALREQRRPPRPTPTPETFLFPAATTTNITRIEIHNQRFGKRITLVKVPGEWLGKDGNGAALPVDQTRIPTMLHVLASLRYTQVVESTQVDPVDLTKFGLTNGGWFIVKFEAAGQLYTLHVGDVNPSATLSYIQVREGGAVYLADYNKIGSLVSIVDIQDAQELATPTP